MRQLIVDSSCEFNEGMIKSMELSTVPFKITMGGETFVDDEILNMDEFLHTMKNSSDVIRTACPSPDDYYRCMKGDEIFVITLTSGLSGTYQSAMIARDMYLEEHPDAKIHVFDSGSATAGETGLGLIIEGLNMLGRDFDEIVEITERFKENSITLMAFSSLTNLARNGRIPKIAGKLSRVLNIKLIAKNVEGKIAPINIERGLKKTMDSLIKKCQELSDASAKYAIVISQVNAVEIAKNLREKLLEIFPDRLVEITSMRGLSSTYAEEGGVVVFL